MNRIDGRFVVRSRTTPQLQRILEIELRRVQDRITASQDGRQFILRCTEAAQDFLLTEGTDVQYGARHLKRAVDRFLVYPLSNLIASGQVGLGDLVTADLAAKGGKLIFSKAMS